MSDALTAQIIAAVHKYYAAESVLTDRVGSTTEQIDVEQFVVKQFGFKDTIDYGVSDSAEHLGTTLARRRNALIVQTMASALSETILAQDSFKDSLQQASAALDKAGFSAEGRCVLLSQKQFDQLREEVPFMKADQRSFFGLDLVVQSSLDGTVARAQKQGKDAAYVFHRDAVQYGWPQEAVDAEIVRHEDLTAVVGSITAGVRVADQAGVLAIES